MRGDIEFMGGPPVSPTRENPDGWHGNLVAIAMRYVADTYLPKEPPYQIWTQYRIRQRSY